MSESAFDKVKFLVDSVEPGILALRNTDQYKTHLKFVSTLPTYSVNNCILLQSQFYQRGMSPEPVMSFSGWRSLDRYVKKGEKAFQIIAPCISNRKVEQPVLDQSGHQKTTLNGEPITETVEKPVLHFKVAYTFAKSQTAGKELPSLTHVLHGKVIGFEDMMKAARQIAPGDFRIEPVSGTANGFYDTKTKSIVIDSGNDEKHQLHTAFHELGHAYAAEMALDNVSRSCNECMAESVSFILMTHALGDQVTTEELGEYTFGYIDSWSPDKDLADFKSMLEAVHSVSTTLIEKYDNALNEIMLANTDALAYQTANGYCTIEMSDTGIYQFSLYDKNLRLSDGGEYDSSERIDIAFKNIIQDYGIALWTVKEMDIQELEQMLEDAHAYRIKLSEQISEIINEQRKIEDLQPITSQQIFAEIDSNTCEYTLKDLLRLAKLQREDALDLIEKLDKDGMNISRENIEIKTSAIKNS